MREHWQGSQLSELLRILTTEAQEKPAGVWAWRRFSHGALVALQADRDGRLLLRIARETRPGSEAGWRAWAIEVEVFLRHFGGASRWHPLPSEDARDVAARFTELFPGEVRPGWVACAGAGDRPCSAGLPYDPVWGARQRCGVCARRAGELEAEEIQARHVPNVPTGRQA